MSANGQARTQARGPQPEQAAGPAAVPRVERAALGRLCANGCGAHTFTGGVCKDCRAARPAPTPPRFTSCRAAVSQASETAPTPPGGRALPAARTDEHTHTGRTFAGVRASVHIKDADAARAEATRELLTRLAAQLGLAADSIEIRVDSEAERRTEARGASGLSAGRVVYLHPRRYDPRTHTGVYLLGHEVVHAAQRDNARGRPARRSPQPAEAEARRLGQAFAGGRVIERPHASLPAEHVAANIGADLAPLDALVAQTHQGEIAKIHKLLETGFFDWAITDGEVTQILTILSTLPFITARSVVAALPEKDQDNLIDNLDTPHYKNFRPQILAAYWGTKKSILQKYGVKLFTPLDLHELQELEILAFNEVFDLLDSAAQKSLREDKQLGPVIAEIKEFSTATSKENITGALNKAFTKALKETLEEERKRADERTAAQTTFKENKNELTQVGDWIRAKLSGVWVSDGDTLAVLDKLAADYLSQPDKLRAIADYLVKPEPPPEKKPEEYKEKDYLDVLLRETPIKQLYKESRRRQVFMRLLTFRPAYKNEALAEELMDTRWWVPVSAEEAYLAYMLVKSLPQRAQATFFKAEGGERWKLVFSEMSQQIRESETLNLYAGGKEGKDKQAILTQLLSDEVWNAPDAARLDGLIRMAIAAGEHEFVFEQSRQRKAYEVGGEKLKALVEKYRLYNPNADPARKTYQPEVLKEKAAPGKLRAILHFLFGDDTRFDISTGDVWGEHIDLNAAQNLLGGSLAGIRLTTPEERAKRDQQKQQADKNVNVAAANVLGDEQLAEVHADKIDIAAINLPVGDTKLQTGSGSLTDLTLRIRASANGWALPAMVDLHAAELVLHDIVLVQRESMKSINLFEMKNLNLISGQVGSEFEKLSAARDAKGLPNPVFAGMLNAIYLAPGVQVKDSRIQEGERPDLPPLPLEFDVTFDSVKLIGLTTSGGQFVESIEIKKLSLHGGGDVNGYRKALKASAERLAARLRAEESAFEKATSPLDLSTHADAAKQLRAQIEHTQTELTRLDKDEAEVKRLEEQQKSAPDSFSAADRIKLRRLKASLSGAVLDTDSVVMRGVAGYTNEAAVEGDPARHEIKLADVHGQGSAASSGVGLLADPGQLRTLLAGPGARATYQGEGKEKARFALDLGHVEIPDAMLKGEIPSAKDAEDDYNKFKAKYEPWRPSHLAELERLEKRRKLATERDALIAQPGLTKLDETQRERFSALSKQLDELEKQGATTVGRIVMEGAALEFGANETIGVGAAKLTATDIRRGANRIAAVTGENVHITVEVTEGVSGLDKWRENLRSLNVSGDSLIATGITNEESGLTIDRASLLGIDEASLGDPAHNATARLKTKMVLVEGVHLKNIEDALIREENYLKSFYVPTASQAARLTTISANLDQLAALRKAVGVAQAKLQAAKTAGARAAAQVDAAAAQQKLDNWAAQLVADRLAASNVDVTLSGLGNVLDKNYDFDKALAAGVRLDGHIDSIEVEHLDWTDGTRRIYSTGKSSLENIDATNAFYSKQQIKIGTLDIGAFTADQIGYNDNALGVEITIASGGLGGISLKNLTLDPPAVEGGKTKISGGTVAVKEVKQLGVGLKMLKSGLKAKGVLSGTDLSAEFATAKGNVYHVGDLSLAGGEISKTRKGAKTPDNIHVTFKHFAAGKITEAPTAEGGRSLTLEGVKLGSLDLGPCRWADGGKSLEIKGRAALRGLSLGAVAVLDKDGNLASFKVDTMSVEEIGATNINAVIDAVSAKKAGEEDKPRKDIHLDSGTIKGLEITGIDLLQDFNKMEGKVTVKDSVDIARLRVLVGEKGKETLKATVSVKAFGKEATDPGLRGRELSATLYGPKGDKLELGTIKSIEGDVEAGGLKTKFETGKVTMGPAIFGPGGDSVQIKDINVANVTLLAPSFKDDKGTEIKCTGNVTVPSISLKELGATFGELEGEKGKKTRGMTGLTLAEMTFGRIDAKGFEYNGATTIKAAGKRAGEKNTAKVTAASAAIEGLVISSFSQDFKEHVTKVDAKLKSATADNFVATLTSVFGKKTTQTEIFGNLNAGGMHATLTLTGTKAYGKDWTGIDGLFELTDPKHGLGLTNMHAVQRVDGKEAWSINDKENPFSVDVTGLKVMFAPNGGLLVKFDEVAAKGLKITSGPLTAEIPLAKLKTAAIGLVNDPNPLSEGLKILGGKIEELELPKNDLGKKITINYTVDRNAPAETEEEDEEGKRVPKTPLKWVLAPLGDMDGLLNVAADDPDAGRVTIPVPIHGGVIDFNEVFLFAPSSWGDPWRLPTGIDPRGIYAKKPTGTKQYLYPAANIPGAVRDVGDVKGSLNLQTFMLDKLNSAPSTDPAQPLTALNALGINARDLQLGGGTIGAGKYSADLPARSAGKNRISITGVSIGSNMTLTIPEVQAATGNFEFKFNEEVVKGKTGEISLTNMNVTIAGLGSATMKFTIKLEADAGKIKSINFGDITLTEESELRKRPAPPKK